MKKFCRLCKPKSSPKWLCRSCGATCCGHNCSSRDGLMAICGACKFSPKVEEKRGPLAVAYGMGVDSTGMLVKMQKLGIRPDAILFADTGGEKPGTYAYLKIMSAWLKKVGFPAITIVKYKPVTAPYSTLEGNCLANETIPSIAFRMGGCSVKFKVEPQERWVDSWDLAIAAWANGAKVVKAIGYDCSKADLKRRSKQNARRVNKPDEKYIYWYALQEWGMTRADCEAVIIEAGLPVPPKSACFFCPSSKKAEIIDLRDNHPDLFKRALAMEAKARDGKHGFVTVAGLGINFAWSDLAEGDGADLPEVEMERP